MTQVTDEMVVAAEEGWSLADNNECSPKECWRAALEAALAVRKPAAHDDILHALRNVHPDNKLASDAADLIERQAEEIARHKEVICMLTDERAELIEALRPFAELINRKWDDKDEAIACVSRGGFVSELQAVRLNDVVRARALLERLGAKEVG